MPDNTPDWAKAPVTPTSAPAWAQDTTPSPSPKSSTSQPGALENFTHGVMNAPIGIDQLLYHLAPEPVQKAMMTAKQWIHQNFGVGSAVPPGGLDELIKRREEDFKKRGGGGTAEIVGEIASPVNYAVPGLRLLTPFKAAVAGGAATGAMQPVTDKGKDYWSQKERQLIGGAVTGTVLGGAGKAVSAIAAPALKGAAESLARAGVPLTPGQIAQGAESIVGAQIKRVEEAAKSFPILGTFIRRAEERSVDGFNRAVVNQALEPIKVTVPKSVAVGHDLIDYARKQLSKKYETLLPKLQLQVDQGFANDLAAIKDRVRELPPAQQAQFQAIAINRFTRNLSQYGTMDGQLLKSVEGQLSYISSGYTSSLDGAQRGLGHAVEDLNKAIRQALSRSNPKYATELKDINASYAMFARVRAAATRRATSTGVFLPSDLLQAIKSKDSSAGKDVFSRGEALMQTFAEAGQKILPDTLRDSGTPERYFWAQLAEAIGMGEIGGYATGAGQRAAFGYPAALLAASSLYSKPISKVLNAGLTGPTRSITSRMADEATRYLGSAGAAAEEMP